MTDESVPAPEWAGNASAREAGVYEYLTQLPELVRQPKYTVDDLVSLAASHLREMPGYVHRGERVGHPTLAIVRIVLAEIERRLAAAERKRA